MIDMFNNANECPKGTYVPVLTGALSVGHCLTVGKYILSHCWTLTPVGHFVIYFILILLEQKNLEVYSKKPF